MPKRVGIAYQFNDIDWLGGKNYFSTLFSALQRMHGNEFDFVLITGRKTRTSLPDDFKWLEVVKTSLMDRYSIAWLIRQIFLRTLGNDPLLSWYLRYRQIDILTHNGPLVKGGRVKSLPWLYDFQFLHLPELWKVKHVKWAKKRYKEACRHSDGIIVSSEDARKDLVAFAPWSSLPIHKLSFVSLPIDIASLTNKDLITKKYKLPKSFFYLPNQFWKNKNHKLVIDALLHLKNNNINITVVCSGKTTDGRQPKYFSELMRYCEEKNIKESLIILGIIPYQDLQSLMAASIAIINPSRFEGWSTTVEEAKTIGKPLLLSDISVHREQAPEVGQFFKVDDPIGLSMLMLDLFLSYKQDERVHPDQSRYLERQLLFAQNYLDILRKH